MNFKYAPIFNQIIKATADHFEREETAMAACNYPWIDNHTQVNQLLLAQAKRMQNKLDQGEPCVNNLSRFISGWLINHIQVLDKPI